jgi:glycogen debranching enzyme
MGASLDVTSYELDKDPSTLRGLPSTLYSIPQIVVPQGLDEEGPFSEIIVPEHFPPGSILVFGTQLQQVDTSLDRFCVSNAQNVFGELGMLELNAMLYRADGEERDATQGEFGAYDVPGHGELAYCGLEGWMHPLRHIMRYNDLGHPLCAHLREGTWAFDYVHARLFRCVFFRISRACIV